MELRKFNDPVLTAVSSPVSDIEKQVLPYVAEMRRLMKKHGGVGLSAPQVGISLRFFVTNLDGVGTVVNPEILYLGGHRVSAPEGCLSKPGYRTFVLRHTEIRLRWTRMKNEIAEGVFIGFAARVLQHEIDHLNGVCIFETP